MFPGDEDDTVPYAAWDLADLPSKISTPAARLMGAMGMLGDRSRFLEEIGFDDPTPVKATAREKTKEETTPEPVRSSLRGKTGEPTISTPKLMEDINGLLRNRPTPMKPGKFDGTGSLESFLVQFEVCDRHNNWTASDRVDYLRCTLEKAATQLLWDFGAQRVELRGTCRTPPAEVRDGRPGRNPPCSAVLPTSTPGRNLSDLL